MKTMDHIMKMNKEMEERFPIIRTGFDDLDGMTALLRRRAVALLASRPGMGRSTLAAQIVANIADMGGYIGWFTTVRSVGEVADKILRVKQDFHTPQNIVLEDRVGNECELRQAIIEWSKPFDLVVVDDLQGMYHVSRRGQVVFDTGTVYAVARDIARNQSAAFLLLSRLMRAPNHRPGYQPLPMDIPHWVDIKDGVDSVFLLHRDGYYTGDTSEYQTATIFAGPSMDRVSRISLLWNRTAGRFLPYDAALL